MEGRVSRAWRGPCGAASVYLVLLFGVLNALASSSGAADEDPPVLERQQLTGNWNGVRPIISAYGFQPYLTYVGSLWSNLAGGNEVSAVVNGYLDFGADIDLAKLGAWDGFGFHADFHWWQGRDPTDVLIGGTPAMSLSGWEAAANVFRVYNLYFRQSFSDDRWVMKIGQLAVDTDFMVSRYAGVFLNGAFGDLPSQNLNIDAPVYPLAAPGFFTSGQVLPWLAGRFGAYTADAGDDVTSNHGFGWKLGNNAGYTFFSEVAVAPTDASLPAAYTLGAIYDTGGSDQFGTGEERLSHYELYLMADQALLADEQAQPVVGVFARVSGSPQDDRNVVGIYADAGVAWFHPLPARPRDVFGVAVSILRFTQDYMEQSDTGGTPVGGGETVLEATYQAALTPWLIVQPDLQFFFNPSVSRRDAYALGGQLVAVF